MTLEVHRHRPIQQSSGQGTHHRHQGKKPEHEAGLVDADRFGQMFQGLNRADECQGSDAHEQSKPCGKGEQPPFSAKTESIRDPQNQIPGSGCHGRDGVPGPWGRFQADSDRFRSGSDKGIDRRDPVALGMPVGVSCPIRLDCGPVSLEEVNPAMIEALKSDEIVRKVGGRFRLTALIQRRLGEIIDGARPLVDRNGMSDLEVVIQEIMQDKITIDDGTGEQA